MEIVVTNLADTFSVADSNFAKKAISEIKEAALAGKRIMDKEDTDPGRLHLQQTQLSKLKGRCMDKNLRDPRAAAEILAVRAKYPSAGKECDAFEELPLRQQYKQQLNWKNTETKGVLLDLAGVHVVPPQLMLLKVSPAEMDEISKISKRQLEKKLKKPVVTYNVDDLLNSLGSGLHGDKLNELVGALLLVTGRRMGEILNSAEFSLGEAFKASGYQAYFAGQLKEGLLLRDKYPIDLLAPYWLVQEALAKVRALVGGLDLEACHKKYEMLVKRHVGRAGIPTPHTLRSIYIMTCSKLYKNRGLSLLGYMGSMLGHENPNSTLAYQTVAVEVSGALLATRKEAAAEAGDAKRESKAAPEPEEKVSAASPAEPAPTEEKAKERADPEAEEEQNLFGLTGHTKPERKAVEKIAKLMKERRVELTRSWIHHETGISMPFLKKLFAKHGNGDIIDAYNKSL